MVLNLLSLQPISRLQAPFTPTATQITRARDVITIFEATDTTLIVIDGKLIEKPVLWDMYRIRAIADHIAFSHQEWFHGFPFKTQDLNNLMIHW